MASARQIGLENCLRCLNLQLCLKGHSTTQQPFKLSVGSGRFRSQVMETSVQQKKEKKTNPLLE